jgi:NADH:ubiquinone oxidoreductase subunit 3 (subunit A)
MASVTEQVSCEHPYESTLPAAFIAPVRALFGWSQHETLFVYAWLLLIVIYLILYFLVPVSFLNSTNGFLNGWITLLSTFIIFFILVFVYVLWTRDQACRIKSLKARYYVFGRKPGQPRYLSQAIERIQSNPANRGRPTVPWTPQRPSITLLEETTLE